MIRLLPVFKGYTVDVRLQEFRRIKRDKPMEFISFTSSEGQRLLLAMAQQAAKAEKEEKL
jgi:hypothetical protein